MAAAVIAFGSNLDNPVAQVHAAIAAVSALPLIGSLKSSSLYRSTPVGYVNQPDFINAVALVQTNYAAAELLTHLHDIEQQFGRTISCRCDIEQQFGRTRSFRNAPRTLDLDIIDYANLSNQSPELMLPHPRAHERSFVMLPLAEIAPDYVIGNFGTAREIAERLGNAGIFRLPENQSAV